MNRITTNVVFTLSLLCICSSSNRVGAAVVGAGAGIVTTAGATDAGTPTNVDLTNPAISLAADTYDVTAFNVSILNSINGGSVVPFLATGSPGNYDVVWVGPAFDPSADGIFNIGYALGTQAFTLTSVEDLYAGINSVGDGVVAIDLFSGLADHDGSPGFGPIAVNDNLSGFSNPALGRRYAFDIEFVAIPEPATFALLGPGLLGIVSLRRRKS